MIRIINKAKKEHYLTKDEITFLLKSTNAHEIFKAADETRKEFVGNKVHLRALIEFSNICKCNCYYCGIRAENAKIERYRLSEEEIIFTAKKAIVAGYKTIVLQSGEDLFFNVEKLTSIIKKIKKYDVALTLSIGERTKEEYKQLKEAGADRFLLRIETTDKELYKNLHPNMSFENRINCLLNLKELGYETGTGCLVGLPNQTLESLANDILFFKEINADMIGIGPLIIHPNTPLKEHKNGNFELALKVMAITRLLLPNINIPATTAMETLKENGRLIALQSGANVIMQNVTNYTFKSKYEIYPGKSHHNNSIEEERKQIEYFLNKNERTITETKGFRINQ